MIDTLAFILAKAHIVPDTGLTIAMLAGGVAALVGAKRYLRLKGK